MRVVAWKCFSIVSPHADMHQTTPYRYYVYARICIGTYLPIRVDMGERAGRRMGVT